MVKTDKEKAKEKKEKMGKAIIELDGVMRTNEIVKYTEFGERLWEKDPDQFAQNQAKANEYKKALPDKIKKIAKDLDLDPDELKYELCIKYMKDSNPQVPWTK